MGTLLDLIGSFTIGGLLLLTLLSVNANISQQSTQNEMSVLVQRNMIELVSEIEYDFKKIGYGVANPALAVIEADTSYLKFWSDIDNDGNLDSVMYSLSAKSYMQGTVNPRDRTILRKVNNQSVYGAVGVITFKMKYYDIAGTVTTNPSMIKTIEYNLVVENAFPIDTTYARSTWNGIIRPRNL